MFFALWVVNWLSSLHSPWIIDIVVNCVSSCEQRLHLEEDARVMSIWSWLEFRNDLEFPKNMKSTRASEMAYSRKLIEVDWQMQRSHCPVGCRTHPQGRSGNYQVQCLSRQGGLFGEDFVFHCHPRRMRPRNESLLFRLFPPVRYIHELTLLYDVSITQAC